VKLLRDLASLNLDHRGGAVSIGNFDGVHLGHARIISELIAAARVAGGPAVVFTFDPHPVRLLRPAEAPPPLTWTDRKAQLLAELGVDVVIAYPTDEALLQLSADDFFQRIVQDALGARAMVEGPNFYFGRGRSGTIDVLRGLCDRSDVNMKIVEPLKVEGDFVSSSRIRKLLADGQVDEARRMLTHPYRLRGMVTHGAGRGAKIGFATANLAAIDTLLPGLGVYAGAAYTDGVRWPAAINVGPNPTFGEHALKMEVHLIDYSGQLYGQPLEVDFLSRLRDIQPFANVQALQAQLQQDITTSRRIAAETLGGKLV